MHASFLLHLWFWVALFSGLSLAAMFFVAFQVHESKELFYRNAGTALTGQPPTASVMASYYKHKKRTFRSANLFYTLTQAYFGYS